MDYNNSWGSDYSDEQFQFWPPSPGSWVLGSIRLDIRISLKNEVFKKYPFLAGDYQLSQTLSLNGLVSWKKDSSAGSFAIWNNAAVNRWFIGPLNFIGTANGYITLPFSNGTVPVRL